MPLLTLLVLTPLMGGVMVAAVPASRPALARGLAASFSLLTLAGVLAGLAGFDPAGGLQFEQRHAWIPELGVEYRVGVDGLGLVMILLTGLLVPLTIGFTGGVRDRVSLHHSLILFLESGLMGTFTALNFFHWFLFWELSLVPAFFLVRLWGGPGRGPAATQFFVYTMAGSVALLLSFLALQRATGTMDFQALAARATDGTLRTLVAGRLTWGAMDGGAWMTLLFFAALAGFAVKIPVMPFHTWLPVTYAEAPSPVTMLLTGAMSKMGVYGLMRLVLPIFPEQLAEWRSLLVALAVVTVVCGAAAAMVQTDIKRMLAYSSVNHLGYCLLAVFVVGGRLIDNTRQGEAVVSAFSGTVMQMFSHGLTAATLFGFVALIEKRSGGARGLDQFGGLRQVAPVFAGLMGIALFSSLGLPGLNGFVGEFLVFKGVFALAPWAAAISVLGLLMTAVFLLTLIQRVFWGPLNERWREFADLTGRERSLVAPAIFLMFLLGIAPEVLIRWFNPTVTAWAESMLR